jgi:hypothetical protein
MKQTMACYLVRLHTAGEILRRESAASQYRVGLLRFAAGRVLVLYGGVLSARAGMNEGWAPVMAPGYSTIYFARA